MIDDNFRKFMTQLDNISKIRNEPMIKGDWRESTSK